jgi:pyruvate/2-oxoglutarate dehydrogenase complex dihydrolipoamide acyltransferase (E2) component
VKVSQSRSEFEDEDSTEIDASEDAEVAALSAETAAQVAESEEPLSDEVSVDYSGEEVTDADDAEETFTLEEVEGATDSAIRLASENGIDINDVVGTGKDGNVLKKDVEDYIEANKPEEAAE